MSEKKIKEVDKQIFQEFLSECDEYITNLENLLSSIEIDKIDDSILNTLMRIFHSLKGTSGFVGLLNLSELTHNLEDLIVQIKQNKIELSEEIIDEIIKGIDFIKAIKSRASLIIEENILLEPEIKYINEIKELISGKEEIDLNSFKMELSLLLNNIDKLPVDFQKDHINQIINQIKKLNKDIELFQKGEILEVEVNEEYIKDSRFYIGDKEITEEIKNLYSIFTKAKKTGGGNELCKEFKNNIEQIERKIEKDKVEEEIIKAIIKIKEDINLLKNLDSEIINFFGNQIDSNLKRIITKTTQKESKKEEVKEIKKVEEEKPRQELESIKYVKIEQDKIDEFMFNIGSIIIKSDSLNYFYSILQRRKKFEQNEINSFRENIFELNKMIASLQKNLLEIRKMPVINLFNKFHRLVRDVTKKLNKKVKLEIIGENVQVDSSVLNELEAPLTHIIRNSLDHGIELPEERKQKGKSETGKIILKAEINEGNFLLTIIDDGKGIDAEKIKMKAIEKGLVKKEAAEKLSENEILNFIFLPGFSTAEIVSDVSGRGVGMDVVKTTLTKLNGKYQIKSTKDVGTIIELIIPQIGTLITKESVIIQINQNKYAILSDDVNYIIKIKPDSFYRFKEKKIISIKNQVIPFFYLAQLLNEKNNTELKEEIPVLIVRTKYGQLAIGVDKILNFQTIVIKEFEHKVFKLYANDFQNYTILGNGEIILILSAETLFLLSKKM
ncbi:MAG TPA: chemotaxis protein CheA [bacterium]|nr:chemotaxis protein CheA [bacterium]HOL48161.1 chemotaxis protein CheA [bacterium]HPQ17762.1 chemotaxis protein CheA [bacterium]